MSLVLILQVKSNTLVDGQILILGKWLLKILTKIVQEVLNFKSLHTCKLLLLLLLLNKFKKHRF